MWAQILEVPPEIWTQVAALSGRQSIARLAAVSRAFYSIFSGILYAEMSADPPLTHEQTNRILQTLRGLPSNEHPARMIRNLHIKYEYFWTPLPQCFDALRNLVEAQPYQLVLRGAALWIIDLLRRALGGSPSNEYPARMTLRGFHAIYEYFRSPLLRCFDALRHSVEVQPGQLAHGAALRVLKWNCARGADELAGILTPVHFPNLKELLVCCEAGSETRFDFIRVRNLENLECVLSFYGEKYDQWQPLWRALKRALGDLPLASPLLHTFRMKLRLDADAYAPTRWDVDVDLIAAINQLRFSTLASFDFALHTSGRCLRDSAMDFSPLLRGNPLLTNVALNITGTCVPPNADGSFLSRLRSFTGSIRNCAAISKHAQSLRNITILFPGPSDIQPQPDRSYGESQFAPTLFPPNLNRDVTSLDVRAVGLNGLIDRYPSSFSPESFNCLVAAFPNLTHLDVSLSHALGYYHLGFRSLPRLQYLGVRLHKSVQRKDHDRLAADLFPAERYRTLVNDSFLPLSHLLDVRIWLWGDRRIPTRGCSSCDEGGCSPPDLFIEYRFGRESGEEEFALVEMGVLNDGTEWRDWDPVPYDPARQQLLDRSATFGAPVDRRTRYKYSWS
ncbi:hypothetical protein DFH06DRAFT_1470007 [Mycena polygramma]|nr:hypothetical protein DFH06DRAFT_1470007 [Mycena polygramma]